MPKQGYDRKMLEEAVAKANSISEVIRVLGLKSAGGSHKHIRELIASYGLDTAHFSNGRKYTREKLESAAQASTSIAGVLRYLGLRQAGGTQAHIGRLLKQFEIDTTHFTGQAHLRGSA